MDAKVMATFEKAVCILRLHSHGRVILIARIAPRPHQEDFAGVGEGVDRGRTDLAGCSQAAAGAFRSQQRKDEAG